MGELLGAGKPDERAGRPPIPGSVWVYQSPDLSMPGGSQAWSLNRCDLEAGAAGSHEQLNGEAFLVALSGTVQLETAGKAPLSLVPDANPGGYVADTNNNLVRKVSPNGVIETVASTGRSGYSGDGGRVWMAN